MITDPPFMPQKGESAFHLRPWTPEELAQCQRMLAAADRLKQQQEAISELQSSKG